MLSSFQRGDCLSGIVTYFGPVVIRLFRLATAVESSERRKTHNVRFVPFPNAYAPAMPLRAKASRWRRLIDRNCAAASADTKGSGGMGFISFSRVPVGLRRSLFCQPGRTRETASPALLLTSIRVVVKRTDQAIAGQVSWGPYGRACNLSELAGISC